MASKNLRSSLMASIQNKFVSANAGNERFKGDKRQLAGLLFGLSICATFFPQASLMTLIGPNNTTPTSGIPFSSLIAGLCVVLIGISGMTTGYLSLVHDYGHTLLTGWVLVIAQTAWIPYITDMTNVAKIASTGRGFIPTDYNPTENDVRFVGAMGVLGVLSFGACFLGSLAFMAFSLYAYQAGKPGDRAAGYYRGRLAMYSTLLFIAGFAQLSLGAFVLNKIGNGPLPDGPVGVAMFTVTYPEISIFVGLIYIMNGLFGLYRFVNKPSGDDHAFQYSIWFQYVCTLLLMIMVQISYLPGGMLAAAAPSRGCLTMGAHVLPAFLDYKARNTPEELPEGYYGDLMSNMDMNVDVGGEETEKDVSNSRSKGRGGHANIIAGAGNAIDEENDEGMA